MVVEKFGDFFVVDRRDLPKQTYVNPKCANMPGYIRLDLKGYLGEVALAFVDFTLEQLKSLAVPTLPEGILVNKKQGNKDPALRITDLPKFRVGDDLFTVEERVYKAYRAAKTLLCFWQDHRKLFDDAHAELQ